MKKILILALFFVTSLLRAQDTSLLDRFQNNLTASCVEVTYSYTTRISGVDAKGNGNLIVQGNKWMMNGNGIEMYCDGKDVWVIDAALKEVVIEPVENDRQTEFMTNPAMLFVRMKDLFKVGNVISVQDGKAMMFSMTPLVKSDIEYLNVVILEADASVREGEFAMADGTLVKIKVSAMTLTSKDDSRTFRPEYVFDPTWIVTDLR